MKHRITLSDEELTALCLRLVPLRPVEFDLKTFSILRHLYGRFTTVLQKSAGG
jgi:hypothetical protein